MSTKKKPKGLDSSMAIYAQQIADAYTDIGRYMWRDLFLGNDSKYINTRQSKKELINRIKSLTLVERALLGIDD